MGKEARLTKLEKRKRLCRGIGIAFIVIGGLIFLPWVISFIRASRVPVDREVILAIGILVCWLPPTGIGILLLLHARHLKGEIQETSNPGDNTKQPFGAG